MTTEPVKLEVTVPLSEEEQRLLAELEQALAAEDPKFASTLRGTTLRQSARRKAILAGVVFVGGIVVLMTGVIAEQPVVGILGFLIMLVSATVGLTMLRGQRNAPASETQQPQTGGSTTTSNRSNVRTPPAAFTRTCGGEQRRMNFRSSSVAPPVP